MEDSIRSSLPPWKGTRVYILTVSLHTVSRLQILFSCISVSKPSLKQVIFSDKRRYRRKTAKFYLLWFEFPRCFEGFWWMLNFNWHQDRFWHRTWGKEAFLAEDLFKISSPVIRWMKHNGFISFENFLLRRDRR